MQQVSGWSEQGGSVVTIPGTQGSGVQRFQQSFRAATVTVRDSSNNLATIYSDDLASPTAKANPFTASSTTGSWSFYVVTGTYSVTFSGGSITAPFSITVNVGLGNAGGVPSYAFASLPTSKSQNAGDLARVTNTVGGLWMDSGLQWVKQLPYVNAKDAPFNARGDGVTNDAAAITAAITAAEAAGYGFVFLPAGNYLIGTTTVELIAGVSLIGAGKTSTTITYTGTGDALHWTTPGAVNGSGFGRILIDDLLITCSNASNVGAAIDFVGGYSYFWVGGGVQINSNFKYGVIFDQSEVSGILPGAIIANGSGISGSANVWLTNGPDHTVGASAGFTNRIAIQGVQLNSAAYKIVDDGGSNHSFLDNNYNGMGSGAAMIRAAAVFGLVITNGEFEAAGSAGFFNILFYDTTLVNGTSRGPCSGVTLHGNFLAGDMAVGAGHGLVAFQAANPANFHTGVHAAGNHCDFRIGQTFSFDVLQLSDSFIGYNYQATMASGAHFTNIHNDANGNDLITPVGAPDTQQHLFGRTTIPKNFYGGIDAVAGGYFLISQKYQDFVIQFTNNAGTLQHRIIQGSFNTGSSGFADKITGASSSYANTPQVSNVVNFTSGAGVVAAATNIFSLNTAVQSASNMAIGATVEYTDVNNATVPIAAAQFASRDVNGTTRVRLEVRIHDALTGAGFDITTAVLAAGETLTVRIRGYLA